MYLFAGHYINMCTGEIRTKTIEVDSQFLAVKKMCTNMQ